MWSSKVSCVFKTGCAVFFAGFLSACTVEPLASSGPSGKLRNGVSSSTAEILSRTDVKPVDTRVAQQVRNNLLFSMNGGKLQPGGRYSVKLTVKATSRSLSVESSSLAPTSAQVAVLVQYELVEAATGKLIKAGTRRALASYDRTPQSFANERALRDAQNRAAKEVAQQVRLAVAQNISSL